MKNREKKGKSIIALPRDYVVIDTETTGLDYDFCDLIEVSAIRYSNGNRSGTFSTLIKPPLTECYRPDSDSWEKKYVDSYITELTGITNEMLENAPTLDQVIPDFLDFISGDLLIGHNANFDINFLYDAAESCGIVLANDYIDTLRMARKVFPELKHHRLIDIATELCVAYESAHRAQNDCVITAQCYERMREQILLNGSEEDFKRQFKRNCRKRAEMLSSISATVAEIDETNPIYGKIVVFTGALSSLERKDAFQIVANLGGIPKDSITKKTNYLIVGNSDFAQSVKDGKTTKMVQAEEYRKKGCDILTMSESAFFDLISDYLQ